MDEGIKLPILESYFEDQIGFSEPWIEKFAAPNTFVQSLVPLLRVWGVELADVAFQSQPSNLGDVAFDISVRKLNAGIRIGLQTIRFSATQPNWGMAPSLIELFDRVLNEILGIVRITPSGHTTTLAFHAPIDSATLATKMRKLFSPSSIGDATPFGVGLDMNGSSAIIERSSRHPNAVFFRLQQAFPGSADIAEIALRIYENEIKILKLIELDNVS